MIEFRYIIPYGGKPTHDKKIVQIDVPYMLSRSVIFAILTQDFVCAHMKMNGDFGVILYKKSDPKLSLTIEKISNTKFGDRYYMIERF